MLPNVRSPWFPAVLLSLALLAASLCSSATGVDSARPERAREPNAGDIGSGVAYRHPFATAGTYVHRSVYHGPMR